MLTKLPACARGDLPCGGGGCRVHAIGRHRRPVIPGSACGMHRSGAGAGLQGRDPGRAIGSPAVRRQGSGRCRQVPAWVVGPSPADALWARGWGCRDGGFLAPRPQEVRGRLTHDPGMQVLQGKPE